VLRDHGNHSGARDLIPISEMGRRESFSDLGSFGPARCQSGADYLRMLRNSALLSSASMLDHSARPLSDFHPSRILSLLSSACPLLASGFPVPSSNLSLKRALSHGSISPLHSWSQPGDGGRGGSQARGEDIVGRLINSFHLARDATPACIYIAG